MYLVFIPNIEKKRLKDLKALQSNWPRNKAWGAFLESPLRIHIKV